jgi:glyoxylase-like metal-dependent hydrolase (beta-lactamase superfamily II)
VLLGVGGDAILVEPATPYDEERAQMRAWIAEHEAAGTRVIAIALTHHHPDHVGAAAWLREALDVPLLAHAATRERLEGAVAIDRTLEDGEVLTLAGEPDMTIEVLHTPGHAPGHLCFVDRASGTMVAGDMVAGTGTILVEKTDGDMGLYLSSLERMAARAPTALIPAHGPTLGPEVLPRYVAHRRAREQKIVDALAAIGGGDIDAIVPVAYADTPPAVWPIARLSTEAHLIELARRGVARLDGDRWSLR